MLLSKLNKKIPSTIVVVGVCVGDTGGGVGAHAHIRRVGEHVTAGTVLTLFAAVAYDGVRQLDVNRQQAHSTQ